MFTVHLVYSRHCSVHFLGIDWLTPHNNPLRWLMYFFIITPISQMKEIKWVTGVTTSKWTSWDTNPRADFLSSSPLLPLRAEAPLRTLKEKWESSQWGRLMCSPAWNSNRWLCQVSGMKFWHWHIQSVYLPTCPFHIHSNPVGEMFLLAIFCICGNSKWLNSDSNPCLFA